MSKRKAYDTTSLKNKTDLPRLLQHLGVRFFGRSVCCPIHVDKNPSSILNEDSIFCTVCSKSFDAIDIVRKIENCSFPQAVKFLQDFVGEKQDLIEMTASDCGPRKKGASSHSRGLTEAGKAILRWFFEMLILSDYGYRYLLNRGMTQEVINKYKLKTFEPATAQQMLLQRYSEDDLISCGLMAISKNNHPYFSFFQEGILIPTLDKEGCPVYFLSRSFREKPKYLKLSGISQPDFKGSDFEGSSDIHCFEGPFDGLSWEIVTGKGNFLVFAGLPGVNAYKMLQKKYPEKNLILALDNDERGQKRTDEIAAVCGTVPVLDWKLILQQCAVPEDICIKDMNDLLLFLKTTEG